MTRAYHGETVREQKWTRMFRRTIKAVVPMDHRYLAEKDGSELAEGRGSGLDLPPDQKPRVMPKTPYMSMTYAPTERRLDTAIFRALFASSTRQARQFVVHGYVRVNGQKVCNAKHRLYLLANPIRPDDLSRLSTKPRRHVPSRPRASPLRHRCPKRQNRTSSRPQATSAQSCPKRGCRRRDHIRSRARC